MQSTEYVYDDDGRVARAVHSPAWTPEDRALVMGLQRYEDDLCLCGHPRSRAWHSEMDGQYEHDEAEDRFLCHACTAANGGEKVTYPAAARDIGPADLPPFLLGVTTTPS